MTMLLQCGNAFVYRLLLQDEKLSRDNFLNWYEKLNAVLSSEGKLHMTKTPLPNPPTIMSTDREIHAFEAAVSDDKDIARVILRSVYPELRSSLTGCTVYGMFRTIQDMYQGKAFDEILEFVSMLRTGNTSAGVRLSSDVLKDYMDRLDRFGSQKLNDNVIETVMKILPNKASDFNMEDWDMVLSHLKLVGLQVLAKGQKDRAVQVAEKMSEGTRGARGCDGIED
ncbi:hypothetical protein Tco_0431736 [Tanacetum coccineum]